MIKRREFLRQASCVAAANSMVRDLMASQARSSSQNKPNIMFVLADGIMHAQLTGNDAVLMGADDPSGGFDGVVRGMCVSVSLSDPKEARRIFDALSDGGSVQMPVTETFFSPAFGMCTDRFGTPWMLMTDPASS